MVHNGIEYAMMQAYAEGWELLEAVPRVTDVREVFRSWTARARSSAPGCSTWRSTRWTTTSTWTGFKGYAEDSGEGRWTVEAAIDHAVPLPAITASLFARFSPGRMTRRR